MQHLSGTGVYVNFNLFTAAEAVASSKKWERRHKAVVAANPKLKREIAAERVETTKKYGGYNDWRLQAAQHQGLLIDQGQDQISKDKLSAEGEAYEHTVMQLLEIIRRTPIGSLLLASLQAGQKVWIIPATDEHQDACSCVASTTPGTLRKAQGGGVRVHFTPIPGESQDHYYSNDDVLFHELVHAYRATWLTITNHRWSPLREYKTEEEFLAVYITNMYRANRGYRNFYRSLSNSTLLSKERIYDYLASDREAFEALRYFRSHDGLASKVSKWPRPEFNPWRDFPQIEKKRASLIDL